MRRFLTIAFSYPRLAAVFFGVGVGACSLTEEVRTRPGAPGEIGFLGSGGSDVDAGAGGASGIDGGGDGQPDGASGGNHGGRGGNGGHSGANAGGTAGDGGVPRDAAPDAPRVCAVDVTLACHDYCSGLSLVPDCRTKLRASAGLGPEPDGGDPIVFTDSGAVFPLTLERTVEKCKCDCELRYRTAQCRSSFDQLIMCGSAPLTFVCSTDPSFEREFPSVIGPGCGPIRSTFVQCLEAPAPPDAGP